MATALIVQYFPRTGFVIAADGRSTRDDMEGVLSDSVQKIFQMGGVARRLAYAMTGCLVLGREDGSSGFDAKEEISLAERSLSKRKFRSSVAYTSHLFEIVVEALRDAQRAGKFDHLPTAQNEMESETGVPILTTVIAGYFDGVPALTEAKLIHKGGIIQKARISKVALDGTWRMGVAEVDERLRNPEDSTFAPYRPSMPTNRYPTLNEVVEMTRCYIAACGSPEALALNPLKAKAIGGRTHIATITPADGFRWLPGYEPL
jgi:hypothetical protein